MPITYADRGPSPFGVVQPGAGVRDSTDGRWGAFSIETFANVNPLRFTHEDASGWLEYLTQFGDRNFWFADEGVKVWAYEETFDNWQDRYGMDAVMAVYHSGHGTMLPDGTFVAPMGGVWNNRSEARSSSMQLGNEKANYVFFSTCLSLRVLDGHSPNRTWAASNLGFRMLFGFETVSIDDPNYGKYFWEEWRKGKTLTQAWLDASWRISTRQAPSVAACGATREEAVNRLNSERLFSADHVSDEWWAWRWYNVARTERRRTLQIPLHPEAVQLAPRALSDELATLEQQAQFDGAAPDEVQVDRQGVLSVSARNRTIGTGPQANRWLQFAEPNRDNTVPISEDAAVEAARDFADQNGYADLLLESVHEVMECCGTRSGEVEQPCLVETLVTFRQAFGGLPVITPGRGEVRVSVDNDGRVVSANISTREFVRSTAHLTSSIADPVTADAHGAEQTQPAVRDPQEALDAAQARVLAELSLRSDHGPELQVRDVPGSTEVGYEIEANEAYLVARKQIEIGPEGGFVTRRWVVAPLAR